LLILASQSHVKFLLFKPVDEKMKAQYKIMKSKNVISEEAIEQLHEYFSKKRKFFDLPLDPGGTPFQKKVWSSLLQIPYGKTFSYSLQAKLIQQPSACRAVGSANGKNPLPIFIPCHRVIAASGTLGGFSAGIQVKKFLLKLEQSN
jgi:methylated-DNA-[protein]-cysteine S-methyltransferase